MTISLKREAEVLTGSTASVDAPADGGRWFSVALCLALLVFAGSVPAWISTFWLYVACDALIFAVLALGLNVSVGVCRQANFGITPFFAVGAYAVANVVERWNVEPILLLLIVTIGTGVVAYAVGLLMLRLHQYALALGTFVLATAVYDFLGEGFPTRLGGGADGMAVQGASLFGATLTGSMGYYMCLVCLVATIAVLRVIMWGRVGRAWLALGKDPLAASSNGIHVRRYGVLAYAVSGAIAGLAGALLAYVIGAFVPDSFSVGVNITVILMVVLGGLGSTAGPVIGAIFVTLLNQVLQTDFSLSNPTLIDGLIVLAIIRFLPGGLFQLRQYLPEALRT